MKVSSSSTFETRTASYLSKSRRRFNAHKKSHTNAFFVRHHLAGQQPSADNRLQMFTFPTPSPDNCSSGEAHSNSQRTTLTRFVQTVARKKLRGTTTRNNSSRCTARADTSAVRGKHINGTARFLRARRVLSHAVGRCDSTKI